MKVILNILLIFSFCFFNISRCSKFLFEKKFPINENEEFPIKIERTKKYIPLYAFLLFQISISEKKEEKITINLAKNRFLTKPTFGDYFSILRYNFTEKFAIDVVLLFKKLSNGKNLKITYFETDSKEKPDKIENKSRKEGKKVLIVRVSLNLKWTLELIQKFDYKKDGSLENGSSGVLICRASGGSPFTAVTILGTGSLEEVVIFPKNVPNEDQNEAHFVFIPKISDHGKIIVCKVRKESIQRTITISHRPTTIDIIPPISGYIKNDSIVVCKASDGYPASKANWTLLQGPLRAELFYSITGTGEVLYIKKNAPRDSKWSFKCQLRNTITNYSTVEVTKTVHFIIGEKPFPLGLFLFWITVSFLLLCLVGLCVFFICFRRNSRDNGTPLINIFWKENNNIRYKREQLSSSSASTPS